MSKLKQILTAHPGPWTYGNLQGNILAMRDVLGREIKLFDILDFAIEARSIISLTPDAPPAAAPVKEAAA